MSADIKTLPNWKKGSSPGEWLAEVAGLAYESPERSQRIVVIYEEVGDDGASVSMRMTQYKIETNTMLLGTVQCAALEVFDRLKGRR